MVESKISEALEAGERAIAEAAEQRAADEAAAVGGVSEDFVKAAQVVAMKPSEVLDVQYVDEVGVAIRTIGDSWYILLLPGVTDANGRSGLLHLTAPKYPTRLPVYQGAPGLRFLQLTELQGRFPDIEEAR
ncbi:MAG: hypothetical protein AB7G23_20100 [Vicinamibacterales bacterium]